MWGKKEKKMYNVYDKFPDKKQASKILKGDCQMRKKKKVVNLVEGGKVK